MQDGTRYRIVYAKMPGAIERLAKYGVKGIRFLDKYSRKAGYGTQNYVIFDDNIMQIIGKKGSSK